MENFGLYIIITNPLLPYTLLVEKCVSHQIKMVQLREKHLPDNELIKIEASVMRFEESFRQRMEREKGFMIKICP